MASHLPAWRHDQGREDKHEHRTELLTGKAPLDELAGADEEERIGQKTGESGKAEAPGSNRRQSSDVAQSIEIETRQQPAIKNRQHEPVLRGINFEQPTTCPCTGNALDPASSRDEARPELSADQEGGERSDLGADQHEECSAQQTIGCARCQGQRGARHEGKQSRRKTQRDNDKRPQNMRDLVEIANCRLHSPVVTFSAGLDRDDLKSATLHCLGARWKPLQECNAIRNRRRSSLVAAIGRSG
jgi:hypothetical protein